MGTAFHVHYGRNEHKHGLYDTGDKRWLWTSRVSRIKPEPIHPMSVRLSEGEATYEMENPTE
jgi:hypothetical protein